MYNNVRTMADEDGTPPPGDPGPRVIHFPRPKTPSTLPTFLPGDKLGLFPLGSGEDIVMGRALFGLILAHLEHPADDPDSRLRLVKMLQAAYSAPFMP